MSGSVMESEIAPTDLMRPIVRPRSAPWVNTGARREFASAPSGYVMARTIVETGVMRVKISADRGRANLTAIGATATSASCGRQFATRSPTVPTAQTSPNGLVRLLALVLERIISGWFIFTSFYVWAKNHECFFLNFRCANGKCIHKDFLCDGEDSCGDNSDETDCEFQPCTVGACSQVCEVKYSRPKTTSKEGQLSSVNTKRNVTSATCTCIDGYALEAKKTCKALGKNATLLVANEDTVMHVNPYAHHRMVELHPELGVHRSRYGPKIESLDFFYDDNTIPVVLWSVGNERVIYYQVMGAKTRTGIMLRDAGRPRGLAVDWLSKNLYFVNGEKKTIAVVKIDLSLSKLTSVRTLVTGLAEPHDIVVHPLSGQMFFSDYGINPKIYVANMDGSARRSFVEAKVLWPGSLAIDLPSER